ncbi:MAG: DUF2817 domain-containing protein [Candidatus Hydrogenedentes bacterium]|nr:DUF2817 domain-containing protein [Candidatus Hydrogenedentota bacterium]
MQVFRRLAIAAVLGGLGFSLCAHAADGHGLYVTEVTAESEARLHELVDRGYEVDAVWGAKGRVYLEEREIAALEAAGYTVTILERQGGGAGAKDLGAYHSYAELTAQLQDYAQDYPDLCVLTSLGTSVQGRQLWALRVSDNPGIDEVEPEFKYISTMHGDEPLGTELLLYLIEALLTGHGVDTRLTAIMDNTDITFVPLMNPDGLELGTRRNANNIDLNRNFPIFGVHYTGNIYSGEGLHQTGRQVEVQRVMTWNAANSFVLSANFHTGALVVNYPYDDGGVASGVNAPTPDDPLMQALALGYAEQNAPMYASLEFPNGIVNGSEWFRVMDGMQDWNYRYLGCIDFTIELSNIKKPAENSLAAFWADNEEALLVYLEAVQHGLRGAVRDAQTDEPLYAKVTVQGNTQPVFSDPDQGDYYRLLLPGTYTVTIEAPGYASKNFPGVSIAEGSATVLDTELLPLGDADNDGRDNDVEGTDDVDGDALPNYLDADSDGDGLPDSFEDDSDADGDLLPQWLDADSDDDGHADHQEYLAGTDPNDALDFLDVPLGAREQPGLLLLCLLPVFYIQAVRTRKSQDPQ